MRGILNRAASRSAKRPSSPSSPPTSDPIQSTSENSASNSNYQALHDPNTNANNPNRPSSSTNSVLNTESSNYKGFNTSITHIFQSPSFSRVDCCSLAFCGILQSDYNRYILHNQRPPTFRNRCFMYILVPIALIFIAGYAAVFVEDRSMREFFVWMLLGMTLAWILGGCWRTSYKHSLARRDLLRKVRAIQRGVVDDSQDEIDLDQTEREIMCAHRMCGCYTTDLSDQEIYGSSNVSDGNYLSRLSSIFALLCCGRLCKCHWQICGICAVAQEGRQLDSLVPIDRRRMDYVTFQSYFDYMNDIRKLRAEKNGKLWHHLMALSKLSRMMVKTLVFVIAMLLTFSLVIASNGFDWKNVLVFVATFIQAFLILYFVHWHWNRFDISLDAVIKYFSCGFIMTTGIAICFELLESILFNAIFQVIILLLDVELAQQDREDDTYAKSSSFYNIFPFISSGGIPFEASNLFDYNAYYGSHSIFESVEQRKKAFQRQYPLLSIIFLFCSAYLIAALVEESCKYFGYAMVEHPDFVKDKDLEKAVALGVFEEDEDNDEDQRFECGGGFECGDYDEDNDEDNDDGDLEHPVRQTITSRFIDIEPSPSDVARDNTQAEQLLKAKAELYVLREPKTLVSTGCAITIAMVSVSLGFACCENLIYIFLYNRGTLDAEIAVLLSRSLFPVHPICAAIQSINVCKQKLENDQSLSLGHIIFPAIILHGSFDFSIMLFNFFSTLSDSKHNHGGYYYENEEYQHDGQGNDDDEQNAIQIVYSICAFVVSVFWVIGGAVYYWREAKKQRIRLEQLDSARNFVGVTV